MLSAPAVTSILVGIRARLLTVCLGLLPALSLLSLSLAQVAQPTNEGAIFGRLKINEANIPASNGNVFVSANGKQGMRSSLIRMALTLLKN
jgi:hypothetical protein